MVYVIKINNIFEQSNTLVVIKLYHRRNVGYIIIFVILLLINS